MLAGSIALTTKSHPLEVGKARQGKPLGTVFKAPVHCLLPSCSGHTSAPQVLHSPHSTPPLFLNPAPLPLGKFLLWCPHHSGNDSDSLETGPKGTMLLKSSLDSFWAQPELETTV